MQRSQVKDETPANLITLTKSSFNLASSWQIKHQNDFVELEAPEKDFSIYFLESPGQLNHPEQINKAWNKVDRQFNLKPAQTTYPPVSDAWDEIMQVNYDVPASEMRFVIAIARIFNNQTYLCLVDAKLTGLSRRSAELTSMVESWKPTGFAKLEIHKEAKDWSAKDIQNFEKFFSYYMQKFQIPGATIAIIRKDGQVVYKNAFGVKQLGLNDPVTIDTPFLIGSTTKSLTTLMMAKLVDNQVILWNTPIKNILKNFQFDDVKFTNKLQFHHTVSASTGMPARDLEWILNYEGVTPEDRILQMKDLKPTTPFGETFQYSNLLFMLGGYAAAHIYMPEVNLENAYLKAMRDLVFKPLGMQRTVIHPSDAKKLKSALPHATNFEEMTVSIPEKLEEACYSVAPAGAIWSTVDDLCRYLLLEMNKGMLNGNRIINESPLLERRKPGVKISDNASYGLGLLMMKEQGLELIGHDGGTLGFSSNLFFLPEKGIGMVILANTAFVHPFFLGVKQKFLELTFSVKQRAEEIANYNLQEKNSLIRQKRSKVSFDTEKLNTIDHLLGNYSSPRLGHIKFYKNDNEYFIEFTGWKTKIGVEEDAHNKKLLVLTSPPWSGCLSLLVDEDQLILDLGQDKHILVRDQPENNLRFAPKINGV